MSQNANVAQGQQRPPGQAPPATGPVTDARGQTVSGNAQYVVQKILERGKQTECNVCKQKFGILTHEHKCKRCYRSICSSHIGGKRQIPSYSVDPIGEHKVCNLCSSECDKLDTMINKVFNMKFGQNNKIADNWFNSLKIDGNPEALQRQFNELLSEDPIAQKSDAHKLMTNLITEMRSKRSLEQLYENNYSFYEVVHRLVFDKKVPVGEAYQKVTQLCHAFVRLYHGTVGFSRGVFDLAVFFLCFTEPARALALLRFVYDRIVPQYAWPSQIAASNGRVDPKIIQWFCKLLRDYFQVENNNLARIADFLQIEGIDFLSSLGARKTNFIVQHTIVTNVFSAPTKEGFDMDLALVRALLAVTDINRDNILRLGPQNALLPRQILEDTQYNEIRAKIDPPEAKKRIIFPRTEGDGHHHHHHVEAAAPPPPPPQQHHHHHEAPVQVQVPQVIATAVAAIPVVESHWQHQLEITGEFALRSLQEQNSQLRQQLLSAEQHINGLEAENRALKSELQILQGRQVQGTSDPMRVELESAQRRLAAEKEELHRQLYEIQSQYSDLQVRWASLQEGYSGRDQEVRLQLEERVRVAEFNYQQLEEKYVKACHKLIIVAAENMRLNNLGADFEQYRRFTKDSRRNTLQWQNEMGIVLVKLRNREEELDRAKKALQRLEEESTIKYNKLKHEYDTVASTELRKFQDHFEIERQFFQNTLIEKQTEIDRLTQLLSGAVTQKEEFALQTINYSGLQQRLNDLEQEKAILTKDLQAYIYKFQTLEREFQSKLELALKDAQFNSISQIEYDRMREKLTTDVNLAVEKANHLESRVTILQQENFRLINANSELQKDSQFFKQQNQQLVETLAIKESELQKREAIIVTTQQELELVRLKQSQATVMSSSMIGNEQIEISRLHDERKHLLDEVQALRTEIEGIRIQFSAQQGEIVRLTQKLERQEQEHIQEIARLKIDYETVCQSTVNNSVVKINQIEDRHREKVLRLEERIVQLTAEIAQRQRIVETFESERAFFTQQLRVKELEIDDFRRQTQIYVTEIEANRQRLAEVALVQARISQLEQTIAQQHHDIDVHIVVVREKEETIQRLSAAVNEKSLQIEAIERQNIQIRAEREEVIHKLQAFNELNAVYQLAQERNRHALMRVVLLTAENERLRANAGSEDLRIKTQRVLQLEQELSVARQNQAQYESRIQQLTLDVQSHHQGASGVAARYETERQQLQQRIQQLEQQARFAQPGGAATGGDRTQALLRVVLLSVENERLRKRLGVA